MQTSEMLYLPFYDGRFEAPGYHSCDRARTHLSRYIQPNPANWRSLVIVYPARQIDGTRCEFYDWQTSLWAKTPLDQRGALVVARHSAGQP